MTTITTSSIRSRALARLLEAGASVRLGPCAPNEDCVRGSISARSLVRLETSGRFSRPEIRSPYHEEMGPHRGELRENRATDSCQVIYNPDAGEEVGGEMYYPLYADIDRCNPDFGLAPAVGHAVVDDALSVGRFFRWIWRKVTR